MFSLVSSLIYSLTSIAQCLYIKQKLVALSVFFNYCEALPVPSLDKSSGIFLIIVDYLMCHIVLKEGIF